MKTLRSKRTRLAMQQRVRCAPPAPSDRINLLRSLDDPIPNRSRPARSIVPSTTVAGRPIHHLHPLHPALHSLLYCYVSVCVCVSCALCPVILTLDFKRQNKKTAAKLYRRKIRRKPICCSLPCGSVQAGIT